MSGMHGIGAYQQISRTMPGINTGPDRVPVPVSSGSHQTNPRYKQTSYLSYFQADRQETSDRKGISSAFVPGDIFDHRQETVYEKSSASQKKRRLIRELKQTPLQEQKLYQTTSGSKTNGFLDLSGSADKGKAENSKKPVNYNYKEVSLKIKQAKTSVSAGQAVLAARRKVLEVKRKISSRDGDAEELQLALGHAERMEMAARKKKHHLELEELADNTRKRDEARDKTEEASRDMENAIVSAKEERVYQQEDAIFEERCEMIHEANEQFNESGSRISEEMMDDLNEMLSEFGEEELKELEDSMEMLENMEIIDPHMSREDLEDLKRKHRAAENKAIMKADMDYLKGMIKHQLSRGVSIPGLNSGSVNTGISISSVSAGTEISIPTGSGSEVGSLDLQV